MYLTAERIDTLVGLLVKAGLVTTNGREALVQPIDPDYVASLPDRNSPLDQVRSDLIEMNTAAALATGDVPLVVWLENAAAMLRVRGRPAYAEFEREADNVRRATPGTQVASQSLSAPALPNHYVRRALLATLEQVLLTTTDRYIGVVGPPGSGKTVLVSALLRTSTRIAHAFAGGTYWVYGRPEARADPGQRGQAADPALYAQRQLYVLLSRQPGETFTPDSPDTGLRHLQQIAARRLAGAPALVVVDDPPEKPDTIPALLLSDRTRLLIVTTTRRLLTAKGASDAAIVSVDRMENGEARELLARWWRGTETGNGLPPEAEAVAAGVGYHPLALAMAGAVAHGSIAPDTVWQDLREAVERGELEQVSHQVDAYPVPQLDGLFDAARESLPEELRERFTDLAVFPEQWGFTLDQLYELWRPREPRQVRRHVQDLVDRSLLQRRDARHFTLHNLLRLSLRRSMNDLGARYRRVVAQQFPNASAMLAAATWHDVQAVGTLIGDGDDLDAANPEGTVALHAAAERGYADIVSALISAGASVDRPLHTGDAALALAAQGGHVETVRLLLQHGANPDGQNREGVTALHRAAQGGYADVVSALLDGQAHATSANRFNKTPLYTAVARNRDGIVQQLLGAASLADQQTDPNETPLRMAAKRNNAAIVSVLLAAGADVNWAAPDGATALHIAAHAGSLDATRILLGAGASVNAKPKSGDTALHLAAQGGHAPIVEVLLAAGAGVNETNEVRYTPLHYAAQNGHALVVRALIDAGADVDLAAKGATALHLAVQACDAGSVDALLRAGADVDRPREDGWSALHLAIHFGSLNLRARQHGVFRTDEEGTSLQSVTVATSEMPAILERLLDAGADVNRPGPGGMTPLHVAADHDSVAAARLLLDADARADLRDAHGRTALDLARQRGYSALVALLEHGSD